MSVAAVEGAAYARGKARKIPAVLPAILLGTGLYLTWFAIHYWRSDTAWPTDPVKALLQGRPIPTPVRPGFDLAAFLAEAGTPVGAPPTPGQTAGSVPGTGMAVNRAVLAQIAAKYVGTGYAWGGPADRPGNWDCSSFVSFCLHEANLPLPGGRWGDPGFPPHSHGPTTGTYLLYGTPIGRADVNAGDLVVWPTHIGIAVSNTDMISAENPRDGTQRSAIDGFMRSEIAQYRRPPAGGTTAPGAPPTSTTAGAHPI